MDYMDESNGSYGRIRVSYYTSIEQVRNSETFSLLIRV